MNLLATLTVALVSNHYATRDLLQATPDTCPLHATPTRDPLRMIQGRVFALGDCAGTESGPLPPTATVAEQQGEPGMGRVRTRASARVMGGYSWDLHCRAGMKVRVRVRIRARVRVWGRARARPMATPADVASATATATAIATPTAGVRVSPRTG